MTFAEAVREVRLAHGLSLSALAVGFGLGGGARLVWGWENGEAGPWCLRTILRAMWEADPTFARIAQEIWRLST